MQSYQEEYIANLKDIAALTGRKKPEDRSFEEYLDELILNRNLAEQKANRNMELLRSGLFPDLDRLPKSSQQERLMLQEFAQKLLNPQEEWDSGLFCQIHQALLNLARLTKDQHGIIRELYWLGFGRNSIRNKLVGLEFTDIAHYISQMRLCFTEAAAYLKYYDEIDDSETRGYILRSRANMALGEFRTASEKIHLVKQTLQILQDEDYQKKAPELPWDRYIYMTHQLMTSSISYEKENTMTADDIADIMESVYIVYERQLLEARLQNEQPPLRSAFHYHAIEYYCGLETLNSLLTEMEHLMDAADPSDFSAENMYGLISLPAFYSQYLRGFPELLPQRKEYVAALYRRILDYIAVFPDATENASLFLYLRQLSHTFVEVENSITYGDFILKLLIRFAPDIYVHSYVVGKAASVFCDAIISEEPGFFDDIPHVREIKKPEEKHAYILNFAMECGLFHDMGKINFISLYSQTPRQWFEDEYEMSRLHTVVGETCLSAHASTCRYASVALGHHSWYDNSSHGYPDSYRRVACPDRQMVDVIGLIDWMEDVTYSGRLYTGESKTFSEAAETAISLEGKQFSPLLTARLSDRELLKQIEYAFSQSRREAFYQLYREESTLH